jgi:tetratricopeptide (TPR) repeat protein
MPERLIQKATRLLKSRRYTAVIDILEPQIFKYRNNFQYYYLLGVSCLYADDIKGADSYLNRARQLKSDDTNCLLGLAAVHLKRMELEEAIKIWLEVLDRDKDNRIARRGLNAVRRDNRVINITEKQNRLIQLYPPIPSKAPLLPIMIVVGFVIVLFVTVPLLLKNLRGVRPELRNIEFPEVRASMVDREGSYRYQMSLKEIEAAFKKARELFNQYRDNLSLVEINRLLHSNAPEDVKNTARILKDYIKKPNFSTLKDSFTLSQIQEDPYLYQDCYVIWKGKLVNLIVEPTQIRFDFLVGYHDEEELEGIVAVTLDFAASLKNGDNLELLGQVRYVNETLSLWGVSIHKIN